MAAEPVFLDTSFMPTLNEAWRPSTTSSQTFLPSWEMPSAVRGWRAVRRLEVLLTVAPPDSTAGWPETTPLIQLPSKARICEGRWYSTRVAPSKARLPLELVSAVSVQAAPPPAPSPLVE